MAKQKFEAPKGNPYSSIIQAAEPAQQPEQKDDFYRFSAKFPGICKDYLQEMAWRKRTTITDYVAQLVLDDMEKHPEWTETIDVLNTASK